MLPLGDGGVFVEGLEQGTGQNEALLSISHDHV